jgi:hypothetical protein
MVSVGLAFHSDAARAITGESVSRIDRRVVIDTVVHSPATGVYPATGDYAHAIEGSRCVATALRCRHDGA